MGLLGGESGAVREFAGGFFGVLDALLGLPVSHSVGVVEEADSGRLSEALSVCPVLMQGEVEPGGTVLCLLAVKDALRLAGMVFGTSDRSTDRLAEHDMATLRELCGHAMKGGLDKLGAIHGTGFSLGETKVSMAGAASAPRLVPELDHRAVVASVHVSASPELEADAFLVLPQKLVAGMGDEPSGASADAGVSVPNPKELFAELKPGKEKSMAPESDESARGGGRDGASNLDMILDIRLVVRARLGRVEMPIADILTLGPGSIVEVGRMLDEPVDLLVNDKLIARGDVVVVDEKFGLRITEIVSQRERIESLR